MRANRIKILSTKIIGKKSISLARRHNIFIDEIPFIEIKHIDSPELQKRVSALSRQEITAIFTSANAVYALQKMVAISPQWDIFCIGHKTKRKVADTFDNEHIVGVADYGAQLAEEILSHPGIKQIFFFCSNRRQNLLPDKLKEAGIEVEELVLYQTIEKPKFVSGPYDGIVFFSPSGVSSFFSKNKIGPHTKLFAIGRTTANCLRDFTDLPVIISVLPDAAQIVRQVIEYFKDDRWQFYKPKSGAT